MPEIHVQQARREIHPALRPAQPKKPAVNARSCNGIGSLGAVHVHALAIAEEAGAGYREFAAHAADHGNDELADLFGRLAQLEDEHVACLPEAAAGMRAKLPAGEHGWLYSGAPLPAARDFILRLLTPRQALEIAVRSEQRAQAFFEQALAASNDAGDRKLALEFGRDEDMHIAWLQDALMRVPVPFAPDEYCPGDPATPQAL